MEGNESPPEPPDKVNSPELFEYSPVITASLASFNEVESSRKRSKPDDVIYNNETVEGPPSKHPKQNVARANYITTDKAPFLVHVSREESSPNSGTVLHPLKFGQFLFDAKIPNILSNGIKRVGRNKISVEFRNHQDANDFIINPLLAKNGFTATIPTYNISRIGLVREIPVDWSPEIVMETVKVPPGCGKIIKVRRINKKVIINGAPEWHPTQLVALTFDGQTLPDHVYCCYSSLKVELYRFPTVQCYNCCRFGHTKTQCRSKSRCYKCSQSHSGETCSTESTEATCISCSGKHFATNKNCPEYVRQTEIKHVMADRNISYQEAARLVAPSYKSFSDVTQSQSSQSPKPILSSPHIPTTSNTSHKKTVTLKPSLRPTPPPGYDRIAHNSIINNYQPSHSANGCALQNSFGNSETKNTPNTIELILSLLLDLIISNNFTLPDHVASRLFALKNINNGGPINDAPMEC